MARSNWRCVISPSRLINSLTVRSSDISSREIPCRTLYRWEGSVPVECKGIRHNLQIAFSNSLRRKIRQWKWLGEGYQVSKLRFFFLTGPSWHYLASSLLQFNVGFKNKSLMGHSSWWAHLWIQYCLTLQYTSIEVIRIGGLRTYLLEKWNNGSIIKYDTCEAAVDERSSNSLYIYSKQRTTGGIQPGFNIPSPSSSVLITAK